MPPMRRMDENQPANYLSSYAPNQHFDTVRTTTVTTATATSTAFTNTYSPNPVFRVPNPLRTTRLTSSSPSYALSSWQRGNSDVKRKQRIMSYKSCAIEGKVKASIRNSFRWVKNKYSSIVHGY